MRGTPHEIALALSSRAAQGDRRPEVVLVRHGQSEWSREGKYAGRIDVALTPEGRDEVKALIPRLREWSFAAVLSSPLQRALDTCREAGYGDVAQIRDDLIEWNYGDQEGRTTPEVRAEHPSWSLWFDGAINGESVASVARRVDRMVEEIRAIDGDVAVFAHRDLLRMLTARWLGLPPEAGRLFTIATGTLSILGWEAETPVLLTWNEDCHLRT